MAYTKNVLLKTGQTDAIIFAKKRLVCRIVSAAIVSIQFAGSDTKTAQGSLI
jgi:hypothetical protein